MASGVYRMPTWIRAKSTAWGCRGNMGRPLISYHMKLSGRIWTSAALPSPQTKGTTPVTSQSDPVMPWELQEQPHPGAEMSSWRKGTRGQVRGRRWQGQKAGKQKIEKVSPLIFPSQGACLPSHKGHWRSAPSDLKGIKTGHKALANSVYGICIFLGGLQVGRVNTKGPQSHLWLC